MKFIDQVPRFALKIRILEVVPLMVMPPSSTKPILVLNFDFSLTGLGPSLVEIGELTNSPTLCLKCVLLIRQGRDQVHGLCWWENTNRTKNFIYSSLTLGTWDKMKLMLSALFNCNMGGKIRRLSMNIAFKYIWPKGLNCLTY